MLGSEWNDQPFLEEGKVRLRTNHSGGFLGGLSTVSEVASTVPALGKGVPGNGDVNPYGVAVVPASTGKLVAGDVLVSNFNDAANNQGTGVTIMEVSPAGKASVFANLGRQVKGPVGADDGAVGVP